MKQLPLLSAAAVLVTVAVVASPAVAGSVLVALGFVAIFAADYGRTTKPLAARGDVIRFNRPVTATRVLRQLAA